MKNIESAFPVEDSYHIIELRLNDIHRFYNTFDPSPFHDKDIDDDAEKYIVDSVRAFSLKSKIKLVVYLPEKFQLVASKELPYTIDHYFDYKAMMARKEFYSALQEGRLALLLGLAFLFICIGIQSTLHFLADNPFGSIFLEGLNIIGWVAMWRPIQIFLYDWWAILRQKKIYEKIRDMPIEVRIE